MKRIISVILTVLLVSALAFTFAVSAEDEFALSVKLPETFEADSTIEFSVTVDKIPAGCVGAPLTFDFEGIDIEADGVVAKCTVEGGEIDFLGELDEPVEGRTPRVERGRPGLDVDDVLEAARDRLEQFGLLARRPE